MPSTTGRCADQRQRRGPNERQRASDHLVRRRTVFLSSTAAGFGDLREALRFELEQRGFDVLAYEESSFPISGDLNALGECLQVVRGADYYLLLIGDDPGRVVNDTSPTREEYRAARKSRLETGYPHLILTVRSSTRGAVDQWRQDEIRGPLGNPLFTASFVEEVEAETGDPQDHNYLQRWASFSDLMNILTTRLQLGRGHEETLARQAVLDELLQNLARMSSRHRTSALPHHKYGEDARKAIHLTVTNLASNITVSQKVANSLGGCFVGPPLGRQPGRGGDAGQERVD